MNKSYERCAHCNRRKWLSSGCLRKWLKPMECKHSQRNIDSKRDLNDVDIVNCAFMPERKPMANKFVKFWKNKLFITGSVRSLQKYFGNKNSGSEYFYNFSKPDASTCSATHYDADKKDASKEYELENQHNIVKYHHAEGHSVLRGHHQHTSIESCALYCQLAKQGWYWGGITKTEAEELLAGQHDNVFLVRDSYDSRHILCVSFRCVGRTLHARLRHADGLFSLNNETFVPPNRISEHCATVDVEMKSQLFEMPVKLARPLNRFAKLDSLQKICRFVIRQTVSEGLWDKLPLPPNLISYVSLGSDYITPL